jgi:hypothetical protein
MMYSTLLAQAALIASLALLGGPASTVGAAAGSIAPTVIATAGMPATHDKARLRCRLYFGCAPTPSAAIDSSQD